MKKRSFFMAFSALLAIGSAVLPSTLIAKPNSNTGFYGGSTACPKIRLCPGGSTFCGYQFNTCTGAVYTMAP